MNDVDGTDELEAETSYSRSYSWFERLFAWVGVIAIVIVFVLPLCIGLGKWMWDWALGNEPQEQVP